MAQAEQFQWTPGGLLDAYSRGDPYQTPTPGIRTVLPSELLNRKTPEQEQAEYDKEVERQSRELDLENKRLKQQSDLEKLRYDANVAKQGQDFLKEMKNLRPGDPDYESHRAEIIDRLPLSVQHDAVKPHLAHLDETDKGLKANNASKAEYDRRQLGEQKNKEIETARNYAAKLGSRALSNFEDMLAKNPDMPAINIVSHMADFQEEQRTVSNLRRNNIPEEEINKFRVPEVDVNNKPTGRTVFDTAKADDYLKSFPSESNLNTALGRRVQLRKQMIDLKAAGEEVPDDLQEDFDLTSQQIARYRQKRGEAKEKEIVGPNAPTRPTSPKDFFKSKTAAPAETVETKAPNELTQEDIQEAAEELRKKRKAKEASEAALKEQQAAQASYNW